MNSLQKALAETCRTKQLEQKYLLCRNLRSGHQLLESLSHEGIPWVNITPVTPLELALGLAEPGLNQAGCSVLSEGEIQYIIDDILSGLEKEGQLEYFADLEGDEGLSGILLPTILEIRASGISAGDLEPDVFVDLKKGKEIKALLEVFEQRLEQDRKVDSAAVFQAAFDLLEKKAVEKDNTYYLVPEQLEFSAVEYAFVERCTAGQRIILSEERLIGTEPSPVNLKGFHFQGETSQEKTLTDSAAEECDTSLAFLDCPDRAPADPGIKVEIGRAYGPVNEVTFLMEKLHRENVALDMVRICYTDAAVYSSIIYSLAGQYGFPVTFEEGFSASFTRPGKLLGGLLNWLADNYMDQHLYRLFYSGLLNVDDPLVCARLLRQAGIGWSLERYRSCLQLAVEEAEARLKRNIESVRDQGKRIEYLEADLNKLKGLNNIIEDILDKLPVCNSQGEVDFAHLCSGLAEIIADYGGTACEKDAAAKEAIHEMLAEAVLSYSGNLELKAALKRLRRRLGGLKIGASGSKPGHLHVSGFSRAEWSARPHTFVVGLNSGSFPGSGLQDPVLLDQERKAISSRLSLKRPEPARNRYRLARFLASCRGSLFLSYSCYDPVESRAALPASVLLQVYRLISGDPASGYSEMEKDLDSPAAYYPPDRSAAFFIDRWWLALVLRPDSPGVDLSRVQQCYPRLAAGIEARSKRAGSDFTIYDGLVSADAGVLDPTKNPNLVVSASRLEALGRCPFAYLYKHVLGVEPPEDLEYEPGAWLDAGNRGHLLHEIYAEFMREVTAVGFDPLTQGSRLKELGEELIEERRKLLPPPNEVIYEYERDELLRELDIFLEVEGSLQQENLTPRYFEVPFGIGPDAVKKAKVGLEEPVKITVSDGQEFKLHGVIDRIDQIAGDDRYRVSDYKTGGTYGFEEIQFINKGLHLQHALYAIAAEKILQNITTSAEVSEAGYIFPTAKGEGRRFTRDQERRDELFEALRCMFTLLSSGTFCVTAEDRCTFCDYKVVCRDSTARQQLKDKLKNEDNRMLEPWKELQSYE